MIFSTLAALADYSDDNEFDFSVGTAICKTTMDDKVTAGQMSLKSETLTVGSKTLVNEESAKFKFHVLGIMNKTPRQELASDMAPYA